jgi:tetratricopeptide (TPR) repeat protein
MKNKMKYYERLEQSFAKIKKQFLKLESSNSKNWELWLDLNEELGNLEICAFALQESVLEKLIEDYPENPMGWYYYSNFLYYKANNVVHAFSTIKKAAELFHQQGEIYGAITNHLLKLALELEEFDCINMELRHLLSYSSEKSQVPYYFLEEILPKAPVEKLNNELIKQIRETFK